MTRELLARLWAAAAGPTDPSGPLTVDLDSTICSFYGRGKQGTGFGYTRVRDYHPQLATLAETGQVIFSRLRGGPAGGGSAGSHWTGSCSPCGCGSRRTAGVDLTRASGCPP